jgi:hypothetical protein
MGLTILLGMFSVTHLGLLWHLWHGNVVTFARWRVPVPKNYYRFGNTFFAHSFGSPLIETRPYSTIHIAVLSAGPELSASGKPPSYERLKGGVVTVANEDGYKLEEERTVQSVAGATYCFQFAAKPSARDALVRCITGSGDLLVSFKGSRQYIPDIYQVVEGLERF